jgi:hypothetical protein
MADDPIYWKSTRRLRTFSDVGWAQLPPAVRVAYNNLRQLRYLPLRPEPTIDCSPQPYQPAPKPFDPNSPLASAVIRSDGDLEQQQVFFGELKVATDAVISAIDGDTRALADRVRKGVATSAEREIAADLLEGKVKRPTHRRKTLRRDLEEGVVAVYLGNWVRLTPEQRPISLAAATRAILKAYGISRAKALEILKQVRAHPSLKSN